MRIMARLGVALLVIGAFLGSIAASGSGGKSGVALAQGPSGPVIVTSKQTSYGDALVTGDGRALYALSYDTVGTATTPASSTCTGRCATAWPPLLVPSSFSQPQATGDVQPSGLGTILRPDGTFQVTYFGHPLYMFINDKAPGQMNGQNVGAFNGLWNLVSVTGRIDAGVATVTLESSPFGSVLSAPTAFNTYRSLYLLTSDGSNVSNCYAVCARFWPPLLTTGAPIAGAGVNPGGLGTMRRTDGTMQVTYFGIPLYLFAFDLTPGAKSGLTNGEDFVDPTFGVWYLLSPAGMAAPGPATITTTTTASLGTVLAYNPTGTASGSSYPVYAFTGDTGSASTCTGFCSRVWAPVLTNTAPQAMAGSGASQASLGTLRRADGTLQVTYNGHPLYTFTPDFSGTDGQALSVFGGTFWLVRASGALNATAPTERSVTVIPQLTATPSGVTASFTVAFTSKSPGQSMVLFGSGPGCAGLVETATRDAGAGTVNHAITVTGNDLPGAAGDNGIQPGATYSFEVVTVGASGQEVDNNKGSCYTVTIPGA
jgi:predicted lipoprotein with Yx(FWY)xxD motif